MEKFEEPLPSARQNTIHLLQPASVKLCRIVRILFNTPTHLPVYTDAYKVMHDARCFTFG